jgi:hypothetical protein
VINEKEHDDMSKDFSFQCVVDRFTTATERTKVMGEGRRCRLSTLQKDCTLYYSILVSLSSVSSEIIRCQACSARLLMCY